MDNYDAIGIESATDSGKFFAPLIVMKRSRISVDSTPTEVRGQAISWGTFQVGHVGRNTAGTIIIFYQAAMVTIAKSGLYGVLITQDKGYQNV